MKKVGKGIITALPFIAMAIFVLVPVFINIYRSFFNISGDMNFVGLENYTKFELSKISFEILGVGALGSVAYFVFRTLYVFCGILGIGSIKNKWVRMLLLFVVGLSFTAVSIPLDALYVIFVIFLFPQKTGIRHAWHSTLIFMGLYLVMSVSAVRMSSIVEYVIGGAEGTYTIFTLKIIPAIILGLIGSKVLWKLKNKTYTENKIYHANGLGNIYIALWAVVCIIAVINSLKETDLVDMTDVVGELILAGVLTLLVSIIMMMISVCLAYNMDKKAVFIITCIMIAINFNTNFYISITGTARSLILMFTLLTKYMMIIALILSVFGREKFIKNNIPAITAVIFPLYSGAIRLSNVITEWEMKKILQPVKSSTESFDTYVYNIGKVSDKADPETLIAVMSFVLICIGIAVATAMLKKEE